MTVTAFTSVTIPNTSSIRADVTTVPSVSKAAQVINVGDILNLVAASSSLLLMTGSNLLLMV